MNAIFNTLRRHPAQYISSLLNNLRSQYVIIFKIQNRNGDPDIDNPQSPLTHVMCTFARTLNISSSQHSIVNKRSTITQQYAWHTWATTIWSYPVIKVDTPGTPSMFVYWDLCMHVTMHYKSSQSPTTRICWACALPDNTIKREVTCFGCIIYAFIHQNTFLYRWNEIHAAPTLGTPI